MRYFTLSVLLAAAPVTALQAQAMPASTFLAKAEALEKKGAMALLSSDVGVLKREVENSGKALRAEQQAAVKAGRKSPYCMPEKAAVTSKELLDYIRAIPVAQRGMPIKNAFAGLIRKKYPCPA